MEYYAGVAKVVAAQRSERCGRKALEVRILSPAPT
jgi:hypothetical protein